MAFGVSLRDQFEQSLGSYGRPRMTEELKELGLPIGHRGVGRIRRENNAPRCFPTLLIA